MQNSRWKIAVIILTLALAFAYLLFGGNGVFHVYQLKNEKAKLEKRIFMLEQTKKALEQEVDRLSGNNPEAQEQVVREQMGMIREDETVYVFPEETTGEP